MSRKAFTGRKGCVQQSTGRTPNSSSWMNLAVSMATTQALYVCYHDVFFCRPIDM